MTPGGARLATSDSLAWTAAAVQRPACHLRWCPLGCRCRGAALLSFASYSTGGLIVLGREGWGRRQVAAHARCTGSSALARMAGGCVPGLAVRGCCAAVCSHTSSRRPNCCHRSGTRLAAFHGAPWGAAKWKAATRRDLVGLVLHTYAFLLQGRPAMVGPVARAHECLAGCVGAPARQVS